MVLIFIILKFYVHVSVHREATLIIVQKMRLYTVYYNSVNWSRAHITVITVICAPDDGWSKHLKHVEQFTEI